MWLELRHFVQVPILPTVRALDLADPRIPHWRLHRLVFKRCDLPCAAGLVRERSEAILLPTLQEADPDVAEFPHDQLALAARKMP